jgi:hypothetical protein
MITEINRIKQNTIFKNEKEFFSQHRDSFVESITLYLSAENQCNRCLLDKNRIAESFYDALFDPKKDCFDKHLCWMKFTCKQNKDIGFFFSSLIYGLLEAFMQYKKAKGLKKSMELIRICAGLQKELLTALDSKETFDVSPYLPKQAGIKYLQNMYRLERGIRFITHTDLGTCPHISFVKQIGRHSAVVQISDEQMTMMLSSHSSFILKNSDDEKNFSVQTEILCAEENTIIIKDIEELESSPLLSRKYPRAAIVHASLVHIANEDEYITGNMLDISEGGMGIMSSSKSHFEKGQNIVAFLSYEDEQSGFKFSFEANGIISSIIGIEHVFRYGIQLSLNDEEKEIVHNLVDILSGNEKEKEKKEE